MFCELWNALYYPTIWGAIISAVVTTFTFDPAKEYDGWDHAWRIYSNTLKGSVWYVSVPIIRMYRLYQKS